MAGPLVPTAHSIPTACTYSRLYQESRKRGEDGPNDGIPNNDKTPDGSDEEEQSENEHEEEENDDSDQEEESVDETSE